MKIKLFFLLMILLYPFQLWAQTASTDSLKITERGYSFRPSQLILPASLITVGALGVANPWLRSLNREVVMILPDGAMDAIFMPMIIYNMYPLLQTSD